MNILMLLLEFFAITMSMDTPKYREKEYWEEDYDTYNYFEKERSDKKNK